MKKILKTPITRQAVSELRIGDIIYLSGTAVTGRDEVHRRVVEEGRKPKVSTDGAALLHVGPIVESDKKGGHRIIAAGPTTSYRMERCEREFLEATGIRLIVGKGGMGKKTAEACKALNAVHCVYPGGCGVSAAVAAEILGVEWEDLGMPEAMWILRLDNFGPLIVSIDTLGENLFERNRAVFEAKKEKAAAELSAYVKGLR